MGSSLMHHMHLTAAALPWGPAPAVWAVTCWHLGCYCRTHSKQAAEVGSVGTCWGLLGFLRETKDSKKVRDAHRRSLQAPTRRTYAAYAIAALRCWSFKANKSRSKLHSYSHRALDIPGTSFAAVCVSITLDYTFASELAASANQILRASLNLKL
jgi:hypothetical protein